MFASQNRLAVTALLIAVLSACGKEPPPVETAPALDRPLAAINVRNGRVLIPQTTLIVRGDVPGVFVLVAGHQARFRMVRAGKSENGRVEILSGLYGDETLIAGDLKDVRDGSLIQKH